MSHALADQDLRHVSSTLQRFLEAVPFGKLRASDAAVLAGFGDRPTRLKRRLLTVAMDMLGWKQVHLRFRGVLCSAFARGTPLQREFTWSSFQTAEGFELKRVDGMDEDPITKGTLVPTYPFVKGWVYFARFGTDGPIKIGNARNPKRRVNRLSVCSPREIFLLGAMMSHAAEKEETGLHKRLAGHRVRGE